MRLNEYKEGMTMAIVTKPQNKFESKGYVHCPICTHTVEAQVVVAGRTARVKPGQKCPRCSSTLDAAYVLRLERAA
ncbi:MAG: hypothetical protein IRZ15_01770 [Bryobacteraceae bacterium]|nr:hypothetical protein [Bryobacteraceae bacterium]